MRGRTHERWLVGTAAVLGLAGGQALAITSNWNKNTAGPFSWQDGVNWNNGVPSAKGDVANVSSSINTTQTITLASSITLGTLNMGDNNSSDRYVFNPVSGTTVTFDNDNVATDAELNFVATGRGDTIATGLVIADGENLTISIASGQNPGITGGISGSGNVSVKAGTGIFSLGGSGASFTGTMLLQTGQIKMATSSTFFNSNTATVAMATGTTWDLVNTGPSIRGLNDIDGAGGTIRTSTNDGTTRQIALSGTGNYAFSGSIQNPTTSLLRIAKTGTGLQVLNGTNSYSGTTTISAGTLQFGKTASLYNATSASWTKANINVAGGATLAVNVGGTGEFGSGDLGTLLTNLSTSINTNGLRSGSFVGLDTTNAAGGAFTYANPITNSTGTGSGAIGLVKLGTGSLILSGTNTYTGSTTVSAGRLIVGDGVSGSLANTAVTVSDNAVLGGSGAIGGTVTTAAQGTLSPGNSPGTLTVGALNAASGAHFDFEIGDSSGGGVSDQLNITGLLTGSTAAGGLVFDFSSTGAGPVEGVVYTLLNFGSVGGLDYSDLAATAPDGFALDTTFGSGGNGFNIGASNLQARFVAVPEPGTAAMLGFAAVAGMIRRRR